MSVRVDLGGRRIIKKKIFFKQKTAYEILRSDWSSDVCSSDLKKRKIPAPIFIAPSGNGRTTARFSERRTVTAPWNSVAPLWPCVPNTCWAIELEAVARIRCAGQRRKREDAVVWSNALKYPENPDDMLSVTCQIRDPDYGALRRDSLPSVPENPETRLCSLVCPFCFIDAFRL